MSDHYTIPCGYAINADGTRRDLTPEEDALHEKLLRASFEQCKKPTWESENLSPVAVMGWGSWKK
jgi:hypothetical protein